MRDDVLADDSGGLGDVRRPMCRPALYEDLAQGAIELRRAFDGVPSVVVPAGTVLIAPGHPSAALYALRTGWACRVREWPDGRHDIPEIYVAGDLIGLEAAWLARAGDEAVALQTATLQALDTDLLSGLLARRSTAVYLAWLMAEAQRRAERRAGGIARLEAKERLAAMLVDLHERLRRRELATAGSFNLPLTQQQIGDHLGLTVVHVNRMVRQLREERLAIIDNHVVMIRDAVRLRRLANGESGAADAIAEDAIAGRPLQPADTGADGTPSIP